MNATSAAPLRRRRFEVSQELYRRFTLLNTAVLVLILTTGATVRLTGSGLGCKHWPGCQAGQPFPTKDYHSFIEFSNRILAGIIVFITLGAWIVALLAPHVPRWVKWTAFAVFFGTAAEAPLGAVTVYYDLNPYLVQSHFVLSIAVLTLATLVSVDAVGMRGALVAVQTRAIAVIVAILTAIMVVSGTLATAAGPHAGSVDVHRIWDLHSAVYWHVRSTALFGLLFAYLLWKFAREKTEHYERGLIVLGILAVQMVIGEIQYRTHLPWGIVLLHVTLSGVLWVAMTAWVAAMFRPSRMT